jgi:hypothetical protein
VDGITERRVKDPVAQATEIGFRFFVVTSREGPPQNMRVVKASVGPLSPEKLTTFVTAYVSDAAKQNSIEISVREFAGNKEISPLLARLAIERLLRGQTLPVNLRDLIQQYVLSLRPDMESSLRPEDFLRAARIAAWSCVIDERASREVSTERVRSRLNVVAESVKFLSTVGSEMQDGIILDQLIACGLLRTNKETPDRVAFSFDPIAEYLCAIEALRRRQELPELHDTLLQGNTALSSAYRAILVTSSEHTAETPIAQTLPQS